MNDLKIERDSSNYRIEELLGEGTYGRVYKARELSTGRLVAIKRTKSENLKEGISAVNLREICFLKSFHHPAIVFLKSVSITENCLDMIFEHLTCDLRAYIDSLATPLPECLIKRFLSQMLSGLHYCHTNRVMHRDLKPQNLLLDSGVNIKIADFGLARCFQVPAKPYTPIVQTLWYRAPEVLLGANVYNTAIDMWSVGCIFSEMITSNPLFPGISELDVLLRIFQVNGTPNEETWPGVESFQYFRSDFTQWGKVTLKDLYPGLCEDGVDLISRMICMNPELRISAYDALNHVMFIQPYLKNR